MQNREKIVKKKKSLFELDFHDFFTESLIDEKLSLQAERKQDQWLRDVQLT